jgi:hypothetical protein
MKYRNAILFVALLLASPLSGFGVGSELSDSCVAAMSRIKSYDAQIVVTMVTYPQTKENAPEFGFAMTNRDVLAIGLGRRVETYLGMEPNHTIGIIDWKTAEDLKAKDPSSKPFLTAMPGYTFHDYYNPEAGIHGGEIGLFLADLLKDKRTEISPLPKDSTNGSFPGFEVNHPGLAGPIRVWTDPVHGQMPIKIKWFVRRGGESFLGTELDVKNFVDVDSETWVPAKATLTTFMPSSPTGGQAVFGFSMEVEPAHSRWNCIDSGELFTAQSLPTMNHQESGWSYCYPPAVLSAIEASDKHDDQLLKEMTRQRSWRRVGLAMLLLTPLLCVIIRRVLSRRKLAQS